MNRIGDLPNRQLSTGPVSLLFRAEGVKDYVGACRWLRDLPYGYNSSSADSLIVFSERCGTCYTKHGTAARLAAELGLPVHKNLVFYRLDGRIVDGVDTLLAERGLDSIPQIHCLLVSGPVVVDLTEGNCTGKKEHPSDFEISVRVAPDLTDGEREEYYRWALDYYRAHDHRLVHLSKDETVALVWRCGEILKSGCSLQAPGR
jgi:hypothetical protein